METIVNETANDSAVTDRSPSVVCPRIPPMISEYIPGLPKEFSVAFGILGLLTVLLVMNYLEELYYLYRHHTPLQGRSKAKWLLCVYPIVALTSLVTLLAPRLSYVNDLAATMYVCVCVHVFVVMIIDQYGGPLKMFRQLRGRRLILNPKPLCCFVCLPAYIVTRVHLQIIHAMVLQFVIIRPLISYILTVMWSDGTFGSTNNASRSPQTYIQIVNVISTFIAMYGFLLVKNQSLKLLSNIYIGPKFYSLQLVLLIIGVQRSVILIVITILQIPCQPPLSFESTVDRYNHMIMIGEMTVLAAVARFLYRHTAQAAAGQIATKYRRKTTSFMVEQQRHKAGDDQVEIICSESSDTLRTSDSSATVAQDGFDGTQKEPKVDEEDNLQNKTAGERVRKISFVEHGIVELSYLKDSVVGSSLV